MYAQDTHVPVSQSRAEIESLLVKYGASQFSSGWNDETSTATIAFKLEAYYVKFVLPIPKSTDSQFTSKIVRGRRKGNTPRQAELLCEKETRRRWRALKLVVQAKLEAVECKISTLVQEFLAFIVLPNGEDIGAWFINKILPAVREGEMPMLTDGSNE